MNIFEIEINRTLKSMNDDAHFFSWRLFDTNAFRGQVPYAPKQPGDWMAVSDGRATLIEAKSSIKEPSFSTDNIRPHQWKALLDFEQAGGNSYFLLNRRSTPRHYQCFAVKPQQLQQIINSVGKKSIRWKLIEEETLEIKRTDIIIDKIKKQKAKGWLLKELPSFSYPY